MLKITLAVAATLLAVAPAAADVVGWATVPSGDMLLINGQNYRVYGIDAVEPHQTCYVDGKPWACGPSAIRTLEIMVGPEPVVCKETGESAGEYGLWAKCTVGGKDIAAELVKAGVAIANRAQSTDYVAAEDAARAGKTGVWQSAFVEPWVLRDDVHAIENRVIAGLRKSVPAVADQALTEGRGGIQIFQGFHIVDDPAAATQRSFAVTELAPGFVFGAITGDVFNWDEAAAVVADWQSGFAGVARAMAFDGVWKQFETMPQSVVPTTDAGTFIAALDAAAQPLKAAGRQPVLVIGTRVEPGFLFEWLAGTLPAEGVELTRKSGDVGERYLGTINGVDIYFGTVGEGKAYVFADDILVSVGYRRAADGDLVAEVPPAPNGPPRLTLGFAQSAVFKRDPVVIITFPFTALAEIYD